MRKVYAVYSVKEKFFFGFFLISENPMMQRIDIRKQCFAKHSFCSGEMSVLMVDENMDSEEIAKLNLTDKQKRVVFGDCSNIEITKDQVWFLPKR